MKKFFTLFLFMLSFNYVHSMNSRKAPARPSIAAPEAYLQELKDINANISNVFNNLVKTIRDEPNNYIGKTTDLATASRDLNNLMMLINTMYEAQVLREKITFTVPKELHRDAVELLVACWQGNTEKVPYGIKAAAQDIEDNIMQYQKKTASVMTSIKGLFKKVETKSKDQKAAIIAGFKNSKKTLENNLALLQKLIDQDLPYAQKLSMSEQEKFAVKILNTVAHYVRNYAKTVLEKLNDTVTL